MASSKSAVFFAFPSYAAEIAKYAHSAWEAGNDKFSSEWEEILSSVRSCFCSRNVYNGIGSFNRQQEFKKDNELVLSCP
jgi:hypothetical protein